MARGTGSIKSGPVGRQATGWIFIILFGCAEGLFVVTRGELDWGGFLGCFYDC